MHSLQSKKYAGQWFNNYKTLHITTTPHVFFGRDHSLAVVSHPHAPAAVTLSERVVV